MKNHPFTTDATRAATRALPKGVSSQKTQWNKGLRGQSGLSGNWLGINWTGYRFEKVSKEIKAAVEFLEPLKGPTTVIKKAEIFAARLI